MTTTPTDDPLITMFKVIVVKLIDIQKESAEQRGIIGAVCRALGELKLSIDSLRKELANGQRR